MERFVTASLCSPSNELQFLLYFINLFLFCLQFAEQKCTKRWKSLRDKFARELKISQDSRWRYFKQMSFLMESIRQYRESLLGKVSAAGIQSNANTVTTQVEATQQTHQHQQTTQQQVVDLFTTPFNGSATITTQSLGGHPHGK